MGDECRPPDGTLDGTVCNLDIGEGNTTPFQWRPKMMGDFDMWQSVGGYVIGTHTAAWAGWRFHSIAEPPQLTGSLAPKPDLRGAARVLGGK